MPPEIQENQELTDNAPNPEVGANAEHPSADEHPSVNDSEPAENEDAASSDDSNESPEKSEPTETKKKGGFQKRIDELTRQRYIAEQEAAQLRDELARQQQQATEIGHQTQKPTLEAYNYDETAWAQAMEQWAEQGIKQQQEIQQQAEQQRQAMLKQAEISRKIQEQTLKAMEKYPDFTQKVSDPSLPSLQSISPAAYEALVTSDNMGEVAYYLANNPAEVYQMGSMSPLDAVRTIARLEAKLTYSASKPTQAPKPPSSVQGKSEAVTNEDKLSVNDWMKRRREQIKR